MNLIFSFAKIDHSSCFIRAQCILSAINMEVARRYGMLNELLKIIQNISRLFLIHMCVLSFSVLHKNLINFGILICQLTIFFLF